MPLKPGSSGSFTNPSTTLTTSRSSGLRLCCAGSIRHSGRSNLTSSSPCSRRAAGSSRSAAGCLSRPAARWLTGMQGGAPSNVSVNVSGRQLDHDIIVDDVREALELSGLDPAKLTVEVTETALMRNAETTAEGSGS